MKRVGVRRDAPPRSISVARRARAGRRRCSRRRSAATGTAPAGRSTPPPAGPPAAPSAVLAVDPHAARRRVEEPRHQRHQRALARPRRADDGEHLPGPTSGHVVQHRRPRLVRERNVLPRDRRPLRCVQAASGRASAASRTPTSTSSTSLTRSMLGRHLADFRTRPAIPASPPGSSAGTRGRPAAHPSDIAPASTRRPPK